MTIDKVIEKIESEISAHYDAINDIYAWIDETDAAYEAEAEALSDVRHLSGMIIGLNRALEILRGDKT